MSIAKERQCETDSGRSENKLKGKAIVSTLVAVQKKTDNHLKWVV